MAIEDTFFEDEGFAKITIGQETLEIDVSDTAWKIGEIATNSNGNGFEFDEGVRALVSAFGYKQKLSAYGVRRFCDVVQAKHKELEKKLDGVTSPTPSS